MGESFLNGRVVLHPGNCLDVLARLDECSVDSCVTDPPYHLTSIVKRFANASADRESYAATSNSAYMSRGFMGKQWDGGDVAFCPETWRAVYRVLKPGAHLVACGGTRTYHRMACAIEDAGFEIRDTISWLYGSGFPKSHDVSKGIDRAAGVERIRIRRANGAASSNTESLGVFQPEYDITVPATDAARQWQGWGTALKPACELIVLARKPLSEGTVAANVLRWGTGAINVDGCRIKYESDADKAATVAGVERMSKSVRADPAFTNEGWNRPWMENGGQQARIERKAANQAIQSGRWPANVAHDGSDEVTAAFPESGPASDRPRNNGDFKSEAKGYEYAHTTFGHTDNGGSAARFFFEAKQDEPCHSIKPASDAEPTFELQSEHVVSVLSNAVAALTPRLDLQNQSVRAQNMSVSGQQLKLIVASVTEAIQNIERRFWLGLPRENITVQLGHAICVATQKPIGITTITIDLLMSGRFVEAVTFDIIETSAEVGASGFGKRLYYTAKADADDRLGSVHPTVKPLDLMQWLVRLVTPRGGVCLDPFAGTGTTGEAAWREGMRAVLIEAEPEYQADIRRRIALVLAGPDERNRESIKAKNLPVDYGPLFGFPEAAE